MNQSCKDFLQSVIHALNEYQDQVPEPLKTSKTFKDVDALISNVARVLCNVKSTDQFEADVKFTGVAPTLAPTLAPVAALAPAAALAPEADDLPLPVKPFRKIQRFQDKAPQVLEFPLLSEFGVFQNRPIPKNYLPLFLTRSDIKNVMEHELKSFFEHMPQNKQNLASIRTFIRLLTRLNISWGPKSGDKLTKVKEVVDKNLEKIVAWVDRMRRKCPKVQPMYLDHLQFYAQQLQLDAKADYKRMKNDMKEAAEDKTEATTPQEGTAAEDETEATAPQEGTAATVAAAEDETEATTPQEAAESTTPQEAAAPQEVFTDLLTHPDIFLAPREQGTHDNQEESEDNQEESEDEESVVHISTLQELAMAYSQSQPQDDDVSNKRPCPFTHTSLNKRTKL